MLGILGISALGEHPDVLSAAVYVLTHTHTLFSFFVIASSLCFRDCQMKITGHP